MLAHQIRLADTFDLYDVIEIERESFETKDPKARKKIHLYVDVITTIAYIWIETKTSGWAVIHSLAVVPGLRDKGYGRALLVDRLTALKASGFNRITLHVDAHNKRGIHLYKSLGFIKIDHVVDKYGKDRHAYLMEKIQ
jgi:ribosomal protein S18 acetylase RimI-like enzyme